VKKEYKPLPIKTSTVKINQDIRNIVELLVKNAHDLWAEQKLLDGWTYGPSRCDKSKKHPCLVPYEQLPEAEKKYDKKMVIGTIKAITALGFKIEKG
jgi:ryanodine receptor 2